MILPWWFAAFCRWRDKHAPPPPSGEHTHGKPGDDAQAAVDRLECAAIFLASFSNEELDRLTRRSKVLKANRRQP